MADHSELAATQGRAPHGSDAHSAGHGVTVAAALMPGSRWYVVQTHPRAESKAMTNLTRQGFEVYLPLYLKRRRHARRFDTVAAPLFPRYLFVAIDLLTQRWRSIQSTFGVAHLVSHGDMPAGVPNSVVEELKLRSDQQGYVQLPRRPRFAPGDKLQICEGAFSDCIGLYEGMLDSQRVAILLDLLGRKVRVILSAESVTAA